MNQSHSYSGVLNFLGYKPRGNYIRDIKIRICQDKIDTKVLEFNREQFMKDNVPKFKKLPLNELFKENSNYNRGSVKKRLLKDNLIEDKCKICGIGSEWQGKPLALQLDHKNGINNDNRLHNLRLVCPNCHTQTPNYAGRGKKLKISELNPDWNKGPRLKQRKIEWPDKKLLEKLLWEKPTMYIAKDYGVSDVAVGKWAKKYGLNKPPRGYWAKQVSFSKNKNKSN